MEKVGMDYSWGKVSCHDGHGPSSWTMPCYEKYPRTGQKRSRKFKLSNFCWFQSEAFKPTNRQKNKSRKFVMGEKRRHFASKKVNSLFNTYQVDLRMYCFQASLPDSRPPPVCFSPPTERWDRVVSHCSH